MANENEFLLHALLMGIFITFVYDILRILRRVFPHGSFLVSIEDIFFWIYCTVRVFLLMHHESNGTMRWFAVFGALAGMLLYKRLASPFLVKYVSWLLRKILIDILGGLFRKIFRAVFRIMRFVLKPLLHIVKKLRARAAQAARRRAVRLLKKRELGRRSLKKKLTFLRKLLKMSV